MIQRIIQERVKHIYIALDSDARKDAVKLVSFFNQFDITAYIVNINEKDPSELGFNNFWKMIDKTTATQFSDLIKERLYG